MNLLLAPKNVDLKVQKIRDNKLDKKQITHLQNLGFVEGANLRVISDVQGSVIVTIKGVRVGLGKDLAECIRVIV
ncbi:MAG: FeoA family protein [Peptoniphilus sp.]|nr:FeoA family protein [Peptoniphilus sp.]MDD7363654.1 FeoA family protein [Bacillota bacterium]MDY6044700.1 FeoA family protein [Peptoniphilus sp.]